MKNILTALYLMAAVILHSGCGSTPVLDIATLNIEFENNDESLQRFPNNPGLFYSYQLNPNKYNLAHYDLIFLDSHKTKLGSFRVQFDDSCGVMQNSVLSSNKNGAIKNQYFDAFASINKAVNIRITPVSSTTGTHGYQIRLDKTTHDFSLKKRIKYVKFKRLRGNTTFNQGI